MAVPAPPLPHAGQHRLGQSHQAEEIGFEHGADFCVFAFLDRREIAVAGIIDQHVDAAEALFRQGHGSLDLGWRIDVERRAQTTVVSGEFVEAGDVARGDDDALATAAHGTR